MIANNVGKTDEVGVKRVCDLLEAFSLFDRNSDGLVPANEVPLVFVALGYHRDEYELQRIRESIYLNKKASHTKSASMNTECAAAMKTDNRATAIQDEGFAITFEEFVNLFRVQLYINIYPFLHIYINAFILLL